MRSTSRSLVLRLLQAAALASLVTTAAAASGEAREASPWWAHVQRLAGDEFQGRLTGSEGYAKAAAYVADAFQRYGLAAAGEQGYFQSVGYLVQTVQPEHSKVTLLRGTQPIELVIGDDLVLSGSALLPPATQGPLVFAGYGIHMPEAGYDDFKGLDIKGAIVVILVGGPAALTGSQRAYGLAETLPRALEDGGAAGLIVMINPKSQEIPWSRVRAASTLPGMMLEEPQLRRFRKPLLAMTFNTVVAESLFVTSGHTFAEMLKLADVHKPLPHFALNAALDAHVAASTARVTADNIVAELPGSDPHLAAEALVLSAHLDHLGTGPPDRGDGVYRGAMDNASGVASLLEIARLLHERDVRPQRSILFLSIAGEEKGLLGSRYFAAHPTRHAGGIVADLNMDCFLPLYPLTRMIGYGLEESSLGEDARAVAGRRRLQIFPDADPDEVSFVRSDQYSFIRRGMPALMADIAPRPGTAEMKISNDWYAQRYHAEADDQNQPVDVTAAADYDEFMIALALRVADAPHRPEWHRTSFFARFQAAPLP
jgi:Zn-dependent M28 family amino/carboxypeptidase